MTIQEEFPMDSAAYIVWFGTIAKCKVVGYDEPTNQVRVSHSPRGNGSLYVSPDELRECAAKIEHS